MYVHVYIYLLGPYEVIVVYLLTPVGGVSTVLGERWPIGWRGFRVSAYLGWGCASGLCKAM